MSGTDSSSATSANDYTIIPDHFVRALLELARTGCPTCDLQEWYIANRTAAASNMPATHIDHVRNAQSLPPNEASDAQAADASVPNSPIDTNDNNPPSDVSHSAASVSRHQQDNNTTSSAQGFEEPDLTMIGANDNLEQNNSNPGSSTTAFLFREEMVDWTIQTGSQPFKWTEPYCELGYSEPLQVSAPAPVNSSSALSSSTGSSRHGM